MQNQIKQMKIKYDNLFKESKANDDKAAEKLKLKEKELDECKKQSDILTSQVKDLDNDVIF